MKVNYFELLSPAPIPLPDAGQVLSPTLRRISSIGYDVYQSYLAIVSMDLKAYLSMTPYAETYELLPEEEKEKITLFQLLTANPQSRELMQSSLNFFLEEDIQYAPSHHGFISKTDGKATGLITKDNYPELCSLICRRNCIKPAQEEDLSKIKSKKALEIMKKIQKGRTEKSNKKTIDNNMELGNIISAVANKSHSLNILTIWDLTVFQLWDCFSRLSNNSIYDIQSMSVAAWGNKDNYFDATAWFKRIDR